MFEQFTEEYFLEQARAMGNELGVDTREGSVYMDAAAGHCIRAAKFYEDLRQMFNMLAADTCSGEVLDEWAKQKQIYRKSATPSYYIPIFEGVSPADLIGDRFMVGEFYFVLVQEADNFYLQSEILGSATNYLIEGQMIIPVRNTMGLSSATLGKMYAVGTDEESDDDLRERWKEALSKPSENWNAQQYKTSCAAYDGVGRALIFALAYGPCTVKAIIISSEGTAPPASLIELIQEEMDPGHEGLGQGKVMIGCKFFAEAPTEQEIDVAFDAVLVPGYTIEAVTEDVRKALITYMKEIALDTPDDERDFMAVQYMKVIGILANIKGIRDFANVTLDGVEENISISSQSVPVLGELTIGESASLRE